MSTLEKSSDLYSRMFLRSIIQWYLGGTILSYDVVDDQPIDGGKPEQRCTVMAVTRIHSVDWQKFRTSSYLVVQTVEYNATTGKAIFEVREQDTPDISGGNYDRICYSPQIGFFYSIGDVDERGNS